MVEINPLIRDELDRVVDDKNMYDFIIEILAVERDNEGPRYRTQRYEKALRDYNSDDDEE